MKLFIKPITIAFLVLLLINACKKDPQANVTESDSASLVSMLSWNYASTPLCFPESNLTNNTAYGFNRAKIAWYNIDPTIFYESWNNLLPANISKDDISADDCRVIYEGELLPGMESPYNKPLNLTALNIDYYPSERGPWNYDTQSSAYSTGIGYDGTLNNPSTRWSGITRKLEITDYAINHLDFWLLDPFTTNPDADGMLCFDLGDISEDVLNDGLLSGENTVSGDVTSSVWGWVKPLSSSIYFPAENPEKFDTGLDEMLNSDEETYFSNYLNNINSLCDPTFYASVYKDPANDDYHSYLGNDYDEMNYKVRDRYKNFNNGELNSFPANENTIICTRTPNTEDINNNGKLDTLNNYYEYKIRIQKGAFVVGENYIVDSVLSRGGFGVRLPNGELARTNFYHFRIPLTESSATYGAPALSSNPKFLRLYLTGFSSPVNLRFINLLVSNKIKDYTLYY